MLNDTEHDDSMVEMKSKYGDARPTVYVETTLNFQDVSETRQQKEREQNKGYKCFAEERIHSYQSKVTSTDVSTHGEQIGMELTAIVYGSPLTIKLCIAEKAVSKLSTVTLASSTTETRVNTL